MSEQEISFNFWKGRRVFLTGHTGFKGGWLALWLQSMGAKVHGYSLLPPTEPNFFNASRVHEAMASSVIADIRDSSALSTAIAQSRPEVVFHLAAQALVRHSYVEPADTYAVNVMGTINLFDAVRKSNSVKAVVNVTTDKCYENKEWDWGYRENDPMGGADPYSSSKGCVELVTAAYRRSFFDGMGIQVASARAGNVIGGGDWAPDRLIPDFLRAMDLGRILHIRSPFAIRPWQHVLEPLSGYIVLAQKLFTDGREFAEGWNFGPEDGDARPVQWIVERLASMRRGFAWDIDPNPQHHEANYLKLDSSKARNRLNWRSRWHLPDALRETIKWHDAWRDGSDMRTFSLEQMKEYLSTSSE